MGTCKKAEFGLDISREAKLCEQHMGKYPVISLILKDVEGGDFETAYGSLGMLISEQAASRPLWPASRDLN